MLLCRWVTLLHNISLCRKKKVVRERKARRRALTWELVLKRARYLCVKKRSHASKPEVLQKQFGEGDLRIKDLSQIDLFFTLLYSCFSILLSKIPWVKGVPIKVSKGLVSHTHTRRSWSSVLRQTQTKRWDIQKERNRNDQGFFGDNVGIYPDLKLV